MARRPDPNPYLGDPDELPGPAFCCCEFIDRHGQRSHLSDASACDETITACFTCSPPVMRRVLADVDDRLRLPQWNGAVHLGFEGALAVILVPVLGAVASIGPQVAALVLLASVPHGASSNTRNVKEDSRAINRAPSTTTSVEATLRDATPAIHKRPRETKLKIKPKIKPTLMIIKSPILALPHGAIKKLLLPKVKCLV